MLPKIGNWTENVLWLELFFLIMVQKQKSLNFQMCFKLHKIIHFVEKGKTNNETTIGKHFK